MRGVVTMNGSTAAAWVYLAHYSAWPAVVLIAVMLHRNSINQLLDALARRSVKFSGFKIQIELGRLSRSIETAELKALAGRAANSSYRLGIQKSVRDAADKDYLVVDIGSVRGAKPWAAPHFFLAPARLGAILCGCAAAIQPLRSEPSRAGGSAG